MFEVLMQMAALIACGVAWRAFAVRRGDLAATRRALADLVFYLLLPALVLLVLWQAELGLDTVRIAAGAAAGVLAALAASWAIYRALGAPAATRGAMLLAAGFPNATYLGLPVLEKTLGPWSRSVAIQYDLFACTPLLLTLGIAIARAHGSAAGTPRPAGALLRVPALWAALAAVALNAGGVPLPTALHDLLGSMAAAVIPLMLIVLGMGLQWTSWRWNQLRLLTPTLVIQLLAMPLLVWAVAAIGGLHGDVRLAVVLEAAMPSMVLGIVLCDRYGLDTPLYAAAVTISTLLSLISLPLWLAWVS